MFVIEELVVEFHLGVSLFCGVDGQWHITVGYMYILFIDRIHTEVRGNHRITRMVKRKRQI